MGAGGARSIPIISVSGSGPMAVSHSLVAELGVLVIGGRRRGMRRNIDLFL